MCVRISLSFLTTIVQYVQLFSVCMQAGCEDRELGSLRVHLRVCVVYDDDVTDAFLVLSRSHVHAC